MFQVGWVLLVFGVISTAVVATTGVVLEPVIGAARFLYFAAALSVFLILLSVLPTDSTLIRLLAYLGCAVLFMGSSACVMSVYSGSWGHQVWLGYLAAVGGYAHTAAFARLLPWRGRFALPARQTLGRVWLVMRSFMGFGGVASAASTVALFVYMPEDAVAAVIRQREDAIPILSACTVAIGYSAVFTPRVRGLIHRRLGRIGLGVEAEEAASVAAMCGNGDSAKLLENAVDLFRCIPITSMVAADLADSGLSGPSATPGSRPAATTAAELAAKTQKAKLGQVSAFFSHSWRDEDEAPGAKYAALVAWAGKLKEPKDATIWLDKACIDQNNVDQALASLPVFLAGCKSLLVVAGSTYCSRLWCVMEIFTFLMMTASTDDLGRKRFADDRIDVIAISRKDGTAADPQQSRQQSRQLLAEQFKGFDAAKAQCFKAEDRQRLLGVVESGFGDFQEFNKLVRSIFRSRLEKSRDILSVADGLLAAAPAPAMAIENLEA